MMTSRIVLGALPRITSRILHTGMRTGMRAGMRAGMRTGMCAGMRVRCRLQVRMDVHGRGRGRFCWHAHMHVREGGMCGYVRIGIRRARVRVHTQAWCAYGCYNANVPA